MEMDVLGAQTCNSDEKSVLLTWLRVRSQPAKPFEDPL